MYSGSLFGPDGKPDINYISEVFASHGNGVIEHTTTRHHHFSFHIEYNGSGYDAVILSQPGYGNRPSGAHETHRLPHSSGYAKVCFAKEPPDLPTTVALAIWWAECTSKYISTGGSWK